MSAFVVLATGACGGASSNASLPNATTSPSLASVVSGEASGNITAKVLPELDSEAPVPTTAGLEAAVARHLDRQGLGGQVLAQVVDVAGGNSILSRNGAEPGTPASTAKLFTAAAALSALGPMSTLNTRTVQGTDPATVILVGGGDVLLGAGEGKPGEVVGRAGLDDLAASTAASLEKQGWLSITLQLDDHVYSGPATAASWGAGVVPSGNVAPIMALEIDRGSVGGQVGRQSDPAMSAAKTFAKALARHGITVDSKIVRAEAPKDAKSLAEITSATVSDLVEYALTYSDNTVAETLARAVALHANTEATFEGAGTAVLEEVSRLGVQVDGVVLRDGSGLSRTSRATPQALTQILATAASSSHPELRPILTGLPVAGASGTLEKRFSGSGQRSARGLIRAKTGTLTGVNSLAGTVVDADGRLLAFAFLAPQGGNTNGARNALDSAAAALAGCGCQ